VTPRPRRGRRHTTSGRCSERVGLGLSGLLVGRNRYDYRKDLAAAGYYTNRSLGVDVGPRFHWGRQNDPTLYRHNLYGFYTLAGLDSGFKDDSRPGLRNSGGVSGFGSAGTLNSNWTSLPCPQAMSESPSSLISKS